MALKQDEVVANYMKIYHGITANVHDANLKVRVNAAFNPALFSHTMRHDWMFRERAEVDLTVQSGQTYVDPSATLKTVIAARVGTSGYLRKMSKQKYNELTSTDTGTTSTPTHTAIIGGLLYPWRIPGAGTVITVIGKLNTNNATTILAAIPEDHERALHKLIDYDINRGSFSAYKEECYQLLEDEAEMKIEEIPEDEYFRNLKHIIGGGLGGGENVYDGNHRGV